MAIGTLGALAIGSAVSGIAGALSSNSAASTQANAASDATAAQINMQNKALYEQKLAANKSVEAQRTWAGKARDEMYATENQIIGIADSTTTEANDFLKELYDKNMALLEPQAEVGRNALDALAYEAGIGAKPTDYAGFEASPGYQFNLDEGNKAIERMAAARGLRLSGGTLKEGARYASGLASQEYGNFYDRIAGLASGGALATQAQVALGQDYGSAQNANLWNGASMSGQAAQNAGNGVANIYSNLGAGIGNAYANIGNASATAYTNMGNAAATGAINVGNATASGYSGANDAFQGFIDNVFSGLGYAQSGMFGANPGFGIEPSASGLAAYGFT
jgi:hypothetical protein